MDLQDIKQGFRFGTKSVARNGRTRRDAMYLRDRVFARHKAIENVSRAWGPQDRSPLEDLTVATRKEGGTSRSPHRMYNLVYRVGCAATMHEKVVQRSAMLVMGMVL